MKQGLRMARGVGLGLAVWILVMVGPVRAAFGDNGDGTVHDTVTIEDVSPILTSISISGVTEVNENSGTCYACTAYYSDRSRSDVTASATWSENSAYATFLPDRPLPPLKGNPGCLTTSFVPSDQVVTITASYEGKSGTLDVTIKDVPPPTLSSISISGAGQVDENSGAQYICTASYSDGSSSVVTGSATWSEDSGYASIDSSGYLTTSSVFSDQAVTITASFGGKSDTYAVTVKDVPPILGDHDFCEIFSPCAAGEGGCGGDSECQEDLVCIDDIGDQYGFEADVNICDLRDTSYVEPEGHCGGDNKPCYFEIQDAIDDASESCKIRIAASTYLENIVLDKKNVRLEFSWNKSFSSFNQAGPVILASPPIDIGVKLNPTNGHYYKFINDKMNFWAAMTAAQIENNCGKLAAITTPEEGQWLYKTFGSSLGFAGWRIFLGGTDSETEGQWIWYLREEAWSYTNWEEEPNDSGHKENCLALVPKVRTGHGYYWDDANCFDEFFFLIEYDKYPTPPCISRETQKLTCNFSECIR